MTEEALFDAALERPDPADREVFLRAACRGDDALLRRVLALLDAHDGAGFLAGSGPATAFGATEADGSAVVDALAATAGFAASDPDRPDLEGPGTQIGPYLLGKKLGEGGMGSVFEAQQEKPVRRKVALKVIKAGMDTRQVVARFDAERQALAIMDHPGIARVLDAGATETGRPFFVMELVEGEPITEYCDRKRLSTRQRVELLIPVCQAVQHAHQKGIVHRDLKPSNVLVAEAEGKPAPKVIDFGIAKAIDAAEAERTLFTQQGAIVGTPEYMSPEQAGGAPDVDTRTDVYALGVLLYELLTGSTPLGRENLRKAGYLEILRRVREEEPPKPSTRLSNSGDRLASISATRDVEPARLSRQVRGELDWIAMKALEKDRARRYGSPADFAADLRRHLDGDAVAAGPPSRSYRLSKFARKHRGGLATAAAFALLLVAATAVSAWQAVAADRARRDAVAAEALATTRLVQVEKANAATTKALADTEAAKVRSDEERERAEGVSDFLVDVFQRADPSKDGRDLKVVDLLEGAEKNLGADFKGPARARVAMLNALGRTYRGLGLYDRSAKVLEDASRLGESALGPDHPETLKGRTFLAFTYYVLKRHAEAIRLAEQTLKASERTLGPDDPDTLKARNVLAAAYHGAGRKAEALALYEATLKASERTLGPDHPETLMSRHNVALTYDGDGRKAEALALLEATLKAQERVLGPDHPSTLMTRANLAVSYSRAGRKAEALALYEATLKAEDRVLGPDHPTTLLIRRNVALLLRQSGRKAEALALQEAAFRDREVRLGPDHPDTLQSRLDLAQAYVEAGQPDRGRLLSADMTAAYRRAVRVHPGSASAHFKLAESLRKGEKKIEEAIAEYREAIRLDPGLADAHNELGGTFWDQSRFAEAVAPWREALRLDPENATKRSNLANALSRAGRTDEAIKAREEWLASRVARLGPDHADTLRARQDLARSLRDSGRVAEATPLDEAALKGYERTAGPDHADTLQSRHNLALDYVLARRPTEAIALDEATLKARERVLGADHPDTLWTRHNLAEAYNLAGRKAEALALTEATLRARERVLGPDHADTAASRTKLVGLYLAAGRNAEAIRLREAIFEERRKRLGPDHADTLQAQKELVASTGRAGRLDDDGVRRLEATLKAQEAEKGTDDSASIGTRDALVAAYRRAGRHAESARLFEALLRSQEAKLPPGHRYLRLTLMNLAIDYRASGRLAEAIPPYEAALKAAENRLGADHADVQPFRQGLAQALQDLGRFDAAEPFWDAIVASRLKALGADHADTLAARLDRADLDLARKRYDLAGPSYRALLADCRSKLGPDHANTAWAERNLLATCEALGDRAAAEPIYRTFVDRARRQGPGSATLANTLANLGACLIAQEKWPEAEPILRECLAIRERTVPNAPATFYARSLLGASLLGQGRLSEAEPLLISGFEGMKPRSGPVRKADAPMLTAAGDRVVRLYEAMGRPETAAAWRTMVHPPEKLPADVFAR